MQDDVSWYELLQEEKSYRHTQNNLWEPTLQGSPHLQTLWEPTSRGSPHLQTLWEPTSQGSPHLQTVPYRIFLLFPCLPCHFHLAVFKQQNNTAQPKWPPDRRHTRRNLFEILINQPEIRLYLPFSGWFGSKRTSVWIQIIQRMVNTIWFRVDLSRFRKYFSVCTHILLASSFPWADEANPLCVMKTSLFSESIRCFDLPKI